MLPEDLDVLPLEEGQGSLGRNDLDFDVFILTNERAIRCMRLAECVPAHLHEFSDNKRRLDRGHTPGRDEENVDVAWSALLRC